MPPRRHKGEVRDAIGAYLLDRPNGASLREIQAGVEAQIGPVSPASVRSYLRAYMPKGEHATNEHFERIGVGQYRLRESSWLRKRHAERNPRQRVKRDWLRDLFAAAEERGLTLTLEPLGQDRWQIGYLRGEQRVALGTALTVENAAESALGALRELGE